MKGLGGLWLIYTNAYHAYMYSTKAVVEKSLFTMKMLHYAALWLFPTLGIFNWIKYSVIDRYFRWFSAETNTTHLNYDIWKKRYIVHRLELIELNGSRMIVRKYRIFFWKKDIEHTKIWNYAAIIRKFTIVCVVSWFYI